MHSTIRSASRSQCTHSSPPQAMHCSPVPLSSRKSSLNIRRLQHTSRQLPQRYLNRMIVADALPQWLQSVLDIFSPPKDQNPQQAETQLNKQQTTVTQPTTETPPQPTTSTKAPFVIKDPVQSAITGSAAVTQDDSPAPQTYSSYVSGGNNTQGGNDKRSSSTAATSSSITSSTSSTDKQLLEDSYSLESSSESRTSTEQKDVAGEIVQEEGVDADAKEAAAAAVAAAETSAKNVLRKVEEERAELAAAELKMAQEQSQQAVAAAKEKESMAGGEADSILDMELTVSLARSIEKATAAEWDALANSGGEVNPFLSWAFLHALETSGSVSSATGWMPQHLLARDGKGRLVGACPLYLKSHSYGEYVFDNSWASASARMGMDYYPKLQSCVPFTPVTGQRILVAEGPLKSAIVETMAAAMLQITAQLQVSGLHMTFNTAAESATLAKLGFMQRTGIQFHWENRGYKTFEDFLADLKQSKRKCIRQERKSMEKQGLTIRRLRGADITPAIWDLFYDFYNDTVDKKWGTAYLSRSFFKTIGATMGQQVLLVIAEEKGEVVAAALNMVGSHAIYGRNWGCVPGREFKYLHFELCYYQAIEEAIACGISRVEAGAQGEHKMQRGYLPSFTHSVHYLTDPQLRGAVSSFLERERQQIEYTWQTLSVESSPFKSETTYAAMVSKLVEYEDMRLSSVPPARERVGAAAARRSADSDTQSQAVSSSLVAQAASSSMVAQAASSSASAEYYDSSSGGDSYDSTGGGSYDGSDDSSYDGSTDSQDSAEQEVGAGERDSGAAAVDSSATVSDVAAGQVDSVTTTNGIDAMAGQESFSAGGDVAGESSYSSSSDPSSSSDYSSSSSTYDTGMTFDAGSGME